MLRAAPSGGAGCARAGAAATSAPTASSVGTALFIIDMSGASSEIPCTVSTSRARARQVETSADWRSTRAHLFAGCNACGARELATHLRARVDRNGSGHVGLAALAARTPVRAALQPAIRQARATLQAAM